MAFWDPRVRCWDSRLTRSSPRPRPLLDKQEGFLSYSFTFKNASHTAWLESPSCRGSTWINPWWNLINNLMICPSQTGRWDWNKMAAWLTWEVELAVETAGMSSRKWTLYQYAMALTIPGHVAVASVVCVIWMVDLSRLSCSNSTGLLRTAVARVDRLRSRCCNTCKGNVQVIGQLGDKESNSVLNS